LKEESAHFLFHFLTPNSPSVHLYKRGKFHTAKEVLIESRKRHKISELYFFKSKLCKDFIWSDKTRQRDDRLCHNRRGDSD
jgi:hypothetical protein